MPEKLYDWINGNWEGYIINYNGVAYKILMKSLNADYAVDWWHGYQYDNLGYAISRKEFSEVQLLRSLALEMAGWLE